MKKFLTIAISLVLFLAFHLCFIGVEVSEAQSAENAQGTLYGENREDHILLQFDTNDSATEYFVYRSTSLTGPWQVSGHFTQGQATTGSGAMEFTPDARLKDLCYKVEALDAKGNVIEMYEPICIPKFAEK
jgi:hypothetical protein